MAEPGIGDGLWGFGGREDGGIRQTWIAQRGLSRSQLTVRTDEKLCNNTGLTRVVRIGR